MCGNSTRGIVYLPLEIVTREYAGKLLLAVELASRGFHAVIGHKGPVNKAAIKAKSPGIYFYKSADLGMQSRPGFCEEIIRRKFITVAQDEEAGIAYLNFRNFYENRSGLKKFGDRDAFFCWGQDDYEFLAEKHPSDKDKLCLTGAPRTFLWTPEGADYNKAETSHIKMMYGRYYLFVSNFAGGNNARGDKEKARRLIKKFGSSPAGLKQVQQKIDQDKRLIKQFADAAMVVHAEFGINVVIRPHPAENWDTWRKLVKDCPGIYVETGYDLISWIRGAEAVIQNDCTTAIEARCARGIPVFAYAEDARDIENRAKGFPNLISKNVVGTKALIHFLSNLENTWPEFLQHSPDSLLDKKVVRPAEGSPRAIARVISSLADKAGHLESGTIPLKTVRPASKLRYLKKSLKNIFLKHKEPSDISVNKRRPIIHEQLLLDIERGAATLGLEHEFFARKVKQDCYLIGRRDLQ